ncbi:MAG: M3 family metallopeptidase [Kiritimatiellae bacterium]|nr:M3 family metallopeptidase [Kiritimatiellia bacterium]
MVEEQNLFPDWDAFTPKFASSELERLLEVSEKDVAAVESAENASYEELVWRLDDATRDLWRVWGRVEHMLSVMNSDAWRELEEKFMPKVVAFSLRVGQSKKLYEDAKRLAAAETDATRKRILEKMAQGAELAGVALEGAKKERFNAIQAELAKLSTDFSNAVLDATKAFKLEKDGKTYTIDDAEYPVTMKHCADREVREKLYRARATRAPENTPRIDEILRLRSEMADILGFEDYAALSLATKCAPGVKAVKEMFDKLDSATKDAADKEDAELGEGLEPWDRAFYAERLREKKYSYSEEELKKYFEFETTLAGLFRMAKFLFGVDVREMKGAERPSVWHEDVRFFEVSEGGKAVAHFYVDPYVRNGLKRGGAWMNEFRNRSARGGATPLALLVLNLPERDAEGKCYMPWREVETLFHEFGHSLQCMLTRVDEEDAAGINLVEWDAVEVASQFMENWCLDDRTLIPVPEDMKAKVRAAKTFRAASACRRQLALASIDMALHEKETAQKGSPDAQKAAIWQHFGMPLIEGDIFLNSFTHIFAGGYAAGYYGYKWSEVMSADCYGAFEEAGLENDAAVQAVGQRYRDTILALGGSKSAFDVFRLFRSRPPEVAALLRQMGL